MGSLKLTQAFCVISHLKIPDQMGATTCSLSVISVTINCYYFLRQSHLVMCSFHEWTLKDKLIHRDSGYIHCKFPQEADALHEKLLTFLDTSIHVHCGQSLKEYIERHDWRKLYEKERWKEWYVEWQATAGLRLICA